MHACCEGKVGQESFVTHLGLLPPSLEYVRSEAIILGGAGTNDILAMQDFFLNVFYKHLPQCCMFEATFKLCHICVCVCQFEAQQWFSSAV